VITLAVVKAPDASPRLKPDRVFSIVDNGSSHRSVASIKRMTSMTCCTAFTLATKPAHPGSLILTPGELIGEAT
jgi:hypothetical protein